MISRIRQKHKTGCAIACVAMLTGMSYDSVLTLMHPYRRRGQHTTTTLTRLMLILHQLNLSPNIEGKRKISSITKPTILVVNCGSSRRPWLHAVIWDPSSKKILDPYVGRNWPRRRYQRALQYCIEIKNK